MSFFALTITTSGGLKILQNHAEFQGVLAPFNFSCPTLDDDATSCLRSYRNQGFDGNVESTFKSRITSADRSDVVCVNAHAVWQR